MTNLEIEKLKVEHFASTLREIEDLIKIDDEFMARLPQGDPSSASASPPAAHPPRGGGAINRPEEDEHGVWTYYSNLDADLDPTEPDIRLTGAFTEFVKRGSTCDGCESTLIIDGVDVWRNGGWVDISLLLSVGWYEKYTEIMLDAIIAKED